MREWKRMEGAEGWRSLGTGECRAGGTSAERLPKTWRQLWENDRAKEGLTREKGVEAECDSTQGGQGERRANCLVASLTEEAYTTHIARTHTQRSRFLWLICHLLKWQPPAPSRERQHVPRRSPFNPGGDPTHITDTSVLAFFFHCFSMHIEFDGCWTARRCCKCCFTNVLHKR